MNTNPALTAYTNLDISDEMEEPKKSSTGSGLLSRSLEPKSMPKSNEPIDRVKDYVTSIRKARKQITNG
jgi:hypothetical protein